MSSFGDIVLSLLVTGLILYSFFFVEFPTFYFGPFYFFRQLQCFTPFWSLVSSPVHLYIVWLWLLSQSDCCGAHRSNNFLPEWKAFVGQRAAVCTLELTPVSLAQTIPIWTRAAPALQRRKASSNRWFFLPKQKPFALPTKRASRLVCCCNNWFKMTQLALRRCAWTRCCSRRQTALGLAPCAQN